MDLSWVTPLAFDSCCLGKRCTNRARPSQVASRSAIENPCLQVAGSFTQVSVQIGRLLLLLLWKVRSHRPCCQVPKACEEGLTRPDVWQGEIKYALEESLPR